jgi:hypothetical protein
MLARTPRLNPFKSHDTARAEALEDEGVTPQARLNDETTR